MARNRDKDEALGNRALDAFARGRFDDVRNAADELGAGYLALDVRSKAHIAELRFAEHGDIDEPAGPFMPPVCVKVPFSMLRAHFHDEAAMLAGLVRLQAELDPAARVVPELTATERAAMLALKRTGGPLLMKTLKAAPINLAERERDRLVTLGLIEPCGSGESKRGVYRLTAYGARVAVLLD